MSFIINIFKIVFGLSAISGSVFGIFLLCQQFQEHMLIIIFSFICIVIFVSCSGIKRFYRTEGESGFYTYKDVYDLLACLSLLFVPAVIMLISAKFYPQATMENAKNLAILLAGLIFIYVSYTTAKSTPFWAFPFVLLTKMILSIVVFLLYIFMPSRRNRENAAIIFILSLILIPVINYLVLDEEGSVVA